MAAVGARDQSVADDMVLRHGFGGSCHASVPAGTGPVSLKQGYCRRPLPQQVQLLQAA